MCKNLSIDYFMKGWEVMKDEDGGPPLFDPENATYEKWTSEDGKHHFEGMRHRDGDDNKERPGNGIVQL